jgi:hypothetical protein
MRKIFIAFIAVVFLSQVAIARFAPRYTYDELLKISDLVVVIEHESTKESEVEDSLGGKGRITSAVVLTQFKGDVKEKKISIHHFAYPDSPNAPNHVTFPSNAAPPIYFEINTPSVRCTLPIDPTRHYLAFLKKQEDGSYIPVTPQYDSNLSFFPLGGRLNSLWLIPENSGISKQGEQSLEGRTFLEVAPRKYKATSGGFGLPVSPLESKSEGQDKPQRESKELSR